MAVPPPLRMTHDPPAAADVVIVGGGISGAALAWQARLHRLACVVIERRPALASLSTSAATGAFRLQFDDPDEMALARESLEFHQRFGEHTGLDGTDLALTQQGYLFCTTDPGNAARQRARVERQRAAGLDDVEVWSGEEVRRRFPHVSPDVVQAVFRGGDGWLDAKRLAVGLARASGATFVTSTEARSLLLAGGRIQGVSTSRGELHAPLVIIASGPFSGQLAATAGLALAISPTRRMRVVLPDVPEAPHGAPMTIDEETGAHWRPWRGGAHAMWTQAAAATEPPLEDVPASDAFAFQLLDPGSPNALARITPFWRRWWERQDGHWSVRAGQYDDTPDRRALLGATPVEGLFLDCGHSGHGVMLAVAAARLVFDCMQGRLAPADNPFRWDRRFIAREPGAL